ncbi:MAG: hypothetical protein LGR52_11540 [Candidatus Thiosymbion ectosymbiont of Robbea hypermnestra]|nr:hypothetical protein [Candidatus Thiosymbion ectosymbiont of Robbea hypermnestra]
MPNQIEIEDLDRILRVAKALRMVIGIEELALALRTELCRLKEGKDIGLRDDAGKPIRSLRGLARAMGNEGAYSYLSKFANENALPCIVIMNQIANTMGIRYIVTNFDSDYKPNSKHQDNRPITTHKATKEQT